MRTDSYFSLNRLFSYLRAFFSVSIVVSYVAQSCKRHLSEDEWRHLVGSYTNKTVTLYKFCAKLLISQGRKIKFMAICSSRNRYSQNNGCSLLRVKLEQNFKLTGKTWIGISAVISALIISKHSFRNWQFARPIYFFSCDVLINPFSTKDILYIISISFLDSLPYNCFHYAE